MGWSPIRRVKETISDVGSALDDAVISKVVDPVVKMGEQFEDLTREGIEGVDEAIQNPYVRMVVGAVIPGSKPWLDAYAKLDSGETLTTADYVSLGMSSAEEFVDADIPEEVKIGLKVGTRINAGEDPVDIFIDEYGENYVEDLDLDTKLDDTLRTYYGDDVANLLKENKNAVQLANDIVIRGKDPSEAIADIYGDQIVSSLGSDDPTVNALGYAGLKTAVGLDQGLDSDEALLAGGEEYYKRGGALPDLNQVASLAGIQDFNLNLNDIVSDLGLDFPDLSLQGYDLPSLANLGIDLNQFNFQAPDILDMNLSLPEIAGLGLDLGNVKFEGYSPQDLGFDVGELADLGINLGDLNLDFETLGLGLALQGQQPREFTPEGDEIALLENEFLVPQIETPFSQQVLGNLKIV